MNFTFGIFKPSTIIRCLCGRGAPNLLAPALVFILALVTCQGADVTSCFVRKLQGFSQTNAGLPVLRMPAPFTFEADAYVDSNDVFTNATIEFPGGAIASMSWDPMHRYRPASYQFKDDLASAESLDTAYPDGTYTMSLGTTSDGLRSISFDLVAPAYPNAPWVSNFDASQQVNAEEDFLLQWGSFIGATTNDAIEVEIWSDPATRVFRAPDAIPFSSTNTSLVIPRGTLQDGRTYVVFLVFLRAADFESPTYPGVPCRTGCDSYNVFQIRTLPKLRINVSSLDVALSWPSSSTGFALEANSSLHESDHWAAITNTPQLEGDSFTLTLPATNHAMFFRLNRN